VSAGGGSGCAVTALKGDERREGGVHGVVRPKLQMLNVNLSSGERIYSLLNSGNRCLFREPGRPREHAEPGVREDLPNWRSGIST